VAEESLVGNRMAKATTSSGASGAVTLEGCSGDDVVLSAEQEEAYKRLAARINDRGRSRWPAGARRGARQPLVARGRHRRLDDWAERM
jgi:hypothetical protein